MQHCQKCEKSCCRYKNRVPVKARLMEKFFRSGKELEDDIASHISKLKRNFSELSDELSRVPKTTLTSEYSEFKKCMGVGTHRPEISQ
ncbi:hypothetical protein TNCT_308901 [Trichonephila clavata]|uniref:Uncharacterized protein n=1 Tax=Trichonephila clavata TaxID=2740835 RepID=A0A8X6KGH1_TRICU|nr:hypothetical protein TNCT_308901 [Trichonephila clavata]